MSRYKGKRFLSLLAVVAVLAAGYFFGDPEQFGSFSQTLGFLYGAYLGGQSVTDWKNIDKGGAQDDFK